MSPRFRAPEGSFWRDRGSGRQDSGRDLSQSRKGRKTFCILGVAALKSDRIISRPADWNRGYGACGRRSACADRSRWRRPPGPELIRRCLSFWTSS